MTIRRRIRPPRQIEDQVAAEVASLVSQRIEEDDIENERRRLENEKLRQDLDERKKYAHNLFLLMVWWVIFIVAVVLFQGFNIKIMVRGDALNNFKLSENVLLALITTTTINLLGLFGIVVTYLFPKQQKKKN